jgi:hypothetical protein
MEETYEAVAVKISIDLAFVNSAKTKENIAESPMIALCRSPIPIW